MTIEAGRQARRSYPYLPDRNWWALRRQFQRTMPRGEVDAAYLASVLSISEPAARNLLGPLRAVGLIDGDNRPTDAALAWRDDEQYRQVTTQILEAVYPDGLRDVAPPPEPDRGIVARWFLRDTGLGEAAADRMARFYLLLAAGDPNAPDESTERPPRPPQGVAQGREPRVHRVAVREPRVPTSAPDASPPVAVSRQAQQPSVHIDIQVHIDPASTAEQIDQIFASMARHLYDRA